MSNVRKALLAAVLAIPLAATVEGQESAAAPAAPPAPAAPSAPRVRVRRINFSAGSYLGVGVREIDEERARELSLTEEFGVEVTSLVPDGPAAKAGLQKGDVVLTYNGMRVEGTDQFVRMVLETPPGRKVKLQVNRKGSMQHIDLTTGSRAEAGHMLQFPNISTMEIPNVPLPDVPRALMSWRSGFLGIEAEAVDSQLAAFFGVKQGVLVRSVNKGTPAEKAGLTAGDVIIKVGGTAVASPREITMAVRGLASRKNFPVVLSRDRKEMTVNVTMDADDDPGSAPGRPNRARNIVTLIADGTVEGF